MLIKFTLLISLCLTVIGAQFIEAPVITNNTDGTFTLSLLDKNSTGIRGNVTATAGAGGLGVLFSIEFNGFPENGGPFSKLNYATSRSLRWSLASLPSLRIAPLTATPEYHVHTERVPEDGNCTTTLGHLDPYNRTEIPPCNSTEPATCQLGDLSGKHGDIVVVADANATWRAGYIDYYLSTDPASNAFFGNLSVVVHSANSTRLNCGNFDFKNATEPLAAPNPVASDSTPPTFTDSVPTETATPTSVSYDGSAGTITSQTTGGLLIILSALLLV